MNVIAPLPIDRPELELMRIANRRGSLVLVDADRCVDVERAGAGLFPADPAAVFDRWTELAECPPPEVPLVFTQMRPEAFPQFNLGRSYPGYSSIGPVLVTPDEFANVDDIAPRHLVAGDEITSRVAGVGEMRHVFAERGSAVMTS